MRTAQESTRQTQTLEAELRAVSSKLEAVGTSLISLQAEGVASEASLAELQAAKRAAEAAVEEAERDAGRRVQAMQEALTSKDLDLQVSSEN